MSWSCLNLFIVLTILQNPGWETILGSWNGGGELIHYKLRYSIFQVGEATVTCKENRTGDIYYIRVEAKSNGLVKFFNRMNYRLECFVNPTTGLPDSTIIDLKDRKHSLYNELKFYQDARSDSARVISKLSGEHVLPWGIYEMLTGFYHFRKEMLSADQHPAREVVIRTFYPDKPWELKFIFAGEEEIKTTLGDQHCYTYHPGTIAGRFFEKEDAMTVWFTKAEPHIPVRFHLDLKIGALHGIIVEYSN